MRDAARDKGGHVGPLPLDFIFLLLRFFSLSPFRQWREPWCRSVITYAPGALRLSAREMEPNGGTAGISPARQFSQVIDRRRLDGVWLGRRCHRRRVTPAVRFPLANRRPELSTGGGGPLAIITSRDKKSARPPAVSTIANRDNLSLFSLLFFLFSFLS
jgi:hypothetical protein